MAASLPVMASAALDEEGHYFDFVNFYRKVEFSDRKIRLEILEESSKDLGRGADVSKDPDHDDIPVSSIVLAAKSHVLRTMLSSGMKESDPQEPVLIKVTTEESEAFKEMLHFLYAGALSPRLLAGATDVRELSDSATDARELSNAATDSATNAREQSDAAADVRALVQLLLVGDKFAVPSLIGAVLKCLAVRNQSLTDNIVLGTQLPEGLEAIPRIKAVAEKARASLGTRFKNVTETWGSEQFLSLDLEVVEFLLGLEELEADSEEEIFKKVLKWVKAKPSSVRDGAPLLDRLVPLIRFGTMRGEYLERLLSGPESHSSALQQSVKEAISFRSYSDETKLKKDPRKGTEREGVRSIHLEVVGDFVLDCTRKGGKSPGVAWSGKKWHISIDDYDWEEGGPQPVDVFLVCETLPGAQDHPATSRDEYLEVRIFMKVVPFGFWRQIGESFRGTFCPEPVGERNSWGPDGGLCFTWEEAADQEGLGVAGPNGARAISVKVVARRLGAV